METTTKPETGTDPLEEQEVERRSLSRRLVVDLSGALTALRTASRRGTRRRRGALEALWRSAGALLERSGSLDLRVVGELLYVNALRLRRDFENYVSFGHVLASLQRAGVGTVRCTPIPTPAEWEAFVSELLAVADEGAAPDRLSRLQRRLAERLVRAIEVGATVEGDGLLPDERERREAAKRTYAHSVAVTKDLFAGARIGRAANVEEVRHALHDIVDQVLDNEISLSGLSTLKDYDDYAFTHSVNVCIFCVALGKRLGLSKSQLYDLGMAALVHDLGMSRIPREIVTKRGPLTEEEERVVESHTWLGALSIFELRDFGEIPVRSMIAAYEHHMKVDGSGYPRAIRPRKPSMFSRIIAVADAFDAATKPRAHMEARQPDEVLRTFWTDRSLGFDPVVVKALINLLGVYPVGCVVILDTFELGIVHAPNPETGNLHRPLVRVVSDPAGTWLDDPPLVDLGEVDAEGSYRRSIIKVTDPERYGIAVSDYFV